MSLKFSIDDGVHAADIVDLVGQVFLDEDFPDDVPPPVRSPLLDMPEEIAIDQGDGVEKIASMTLSNELLPVGRIPAIARDRHAEFSAEIDGKPLCLMIENRFTKQCADAMPCSATVLHRVSGLQVQGAESLSGHSVSFLKNVHSPLRT